jgi:hypothetical protein
VTKLDETSPTLNTGSTHRELAVSLSTETVPPTQSFNIMVIELPASQGSLKNLSSFEVAATLKIMN